MDRELQILKRAVESDLENKAARDRLIAYLDRTKPLACQRCESLGQWETIDKINDNPSIHPIMSAFAPTITFNNAIYYSIRQCCRICGFITAHAVFKEREKERYQRGEPESYLSPEERAEGWSIINKYRNQELIAIPLSNAVEVFISSNIRHATDAINYDVKIRIKQNGEVEQTESMAKSISAQNLIGYLYSINSQSTFENIKSLLAGMIASDSSFRTRSMEFDEIAFIELIQKSSFKTFKPFITNIIKLLRDHYEKSQDDLERLEELHDICREAIRNEYLEFTKTNNPEDYERIAAELESDTPYNGYYQLNFSLFQDPNGVRGLYALPELPRRS